MPALPETDKGTFFAAKRSLGIVVGLVVILSALTFVFFLIYSKRGKADLGELFLKEFKTSTNEVDFGADFRKARYLDNFELSATAESKIDKFKPLNQNFDYLTSVYISTHDPFLRTKAIELADYLKSNYSKESSGFKLEVPCLDSSCTSIEYPTEIKEVLKLSESAKFPEDSNYQAFVKKSLESAVIASDKLDKFNNYLTALEYFSIAYQKKQDANVKLAGEKLLEFIKANFSQEFKNQTNLNGEDKFAFK